MNDPITITQALVRMTGDGRTDEQIARDGARITIGQIDRLRNQLNQAERACQHVIAKGKPLKGDNLIWKRVRRCAEKLLEGMVDE